MLEILKAVLFGIIEGITEWLPISSTGHLILLEEMVSLDVSETFFKMFKVVIQLGAILAVVLLYFHKLNPFSPKKTEKQKTMTWGLWFKVIVAVLPSAVIGLLLDDFLEEHLFTPTVVACALIFYGLAFILAEKRRKLVPLEGQITKKTAIGIGFFQVLALIPGTSRSGATMLGGTLLGLPRERAAEFSFFLAIPTMLGASALKCAKFFSEGNALLQEEVRMLAVGALAAFLVSLVTIRFLLGFVKRHGFLGFGIYRILLGVAVLWLV